MVNCLGENTPPNPLLIPGFCVSPNLRFFFSTTVSRFVVEVAPAKDFWFGIFELEFAKLGFSDKN